MLADFHVHSEFSDDSVYPMERVAAVLEEAIRRDKALELNTSSWRYGLDDLMPATNVWCLYRDLGGRLVTLGSDSHKPEHLGAHLKEAQAALHDLGLEEYFTYRQHVPEGHKLPTV